MRWLRSKKTKHSVLVDLEHAEGLDETLTTVPGPVFEPPIDTEEESESESGEASS